MMNKSNAQGRLTRPWWRGRAVVGLVLTLLLLFSGTALAAEITGGEAYVLPRGQVINDDLVVSGGEVIIDGTVEGDLVVAGGYVEVNGVVMGDLLAAGGAVVVAGAVQDDVRVAGGGVILSGSVGDDLFAAAGGTAVPGVPAMPITVNGRSVPQGLQIGPNATVGGDAFVVGGAGAVAGSIGRNLNAGMGSLVFSGRVAGNAQLTAEQLTVSDSAVVQGELRYTTRNGGVPAGVAASVVEEPPLPEPPQAAPNPVWQVVSWLFRTALLVVGALLVGWLAWSFSRPRLLDLTGVMTARPVEAGVWGLVVAMAVLPVSATLVFVAVLFWGWFPGGAVMLTFLFGLVGALWIISPVLTGLWVGRWIGRSAGVVQGDLAQLLVGIAVIVLAGRLLALVPCVGELAFRVVYLASFALAVGSWALLRRGPTVPVAATPAPAEAAG
jgi:cytoskeletal protein CcmA (bactofilin family)